MPSLNMTVQRLKVAILPLDLPCSGPVTHSGKFLTTGKSNGKKPDVPIKVAKNSSFSYKNPFSHSPSGVHGNFVRGGGGSTNSVEGRGQREPGSGGGSPLVSGSRGSCNFVQEISFYIVKCLVL